MCVQDGGAAFFTQTMVEFLKGAEEAVAQLRTQSTDTMELLRNLYAYFGERYDGNDPVKILGTLAAFLDLYAKSVKQYRVCTVPHCPSNMVFSVFGSIRPRAGCFVGFAIQICEMPVLRVHYVRFCRNVVRRVFQEF